LSDNPLAALMRLAEPDRLCVPDCCLYNECARQSLMPSRTLPSPRWLYRFHAFLQRLPIPAWLLGLLIALIAALGFHLEAWRLGALPFGALDPYLITVGNYPILLFAVWFLLDDQARFILTRFFKHSNKGLSRLESTLADFISLPDRLAMPTLLVGLLFGYFNYQLALSLTPMAGRVSPAFELLGFLLVGGWVGLMFPRSLRQAILLRRLYADVKVNIFNPAPLYVLSLYSSQSTLALVLMNYIIILLAMPRFLMTTNGYITSILLVSSMLAFFFVSVSGIHRRMGNEKDRLLSGLGEGLNKETARLLQAGRRGSYAEIADIRSTISSHKESLDIVRKISTWPWEPETVRNLLIPLLFPVIVFLIQRYLGSLLGG
jgi:hypothetical protein